ncbi:hypothetical protein EB837_06210 [Kluyvera ascorbata]|uniref:Uncharacterized protein n=1 Tax=Kluyvera ascorbata TaxID=51288 RepID=A0A3N2S887_9ENTR|nr:hypothetical protein EB837_06210 [Kluyvera ascorbata]
MCQKDCIRCPQAGRILRHQYVMQRCQINGAYLHKSIDKRRLNGHIPRPLNCPYRTHLGVGLG